jgi:hypothetical protein
MDNEVKDNEVKKLLDVKKMPNYKVIKKNKNKKSTDEQADNSFYISPDDKKHLDHIFWID